MLHQFFQGSECTHASLSIPQCGSRAIQPKVMIHHWLFRLMLVLLIFPAFQSAHSNALDFDGTNDYLEIPYTNGNAYDFDSNLFTVELWIRPKSDTASDNPLLAVISSTFDGLLISSNTTNGISVEVRLGLGAGDVAYLDYATDLADGNWHHVAVVRDTGNVFRLYVDGDLKDTDTLTPSDTSIDIVGNPARIGVSTVPATGALGSVYYEGRFDELRVWWEARTQTEIQNNMYGRLTGTEANLRVYYNFNQGVANEINVISTVLDSASSPLSENASIKNFAMANHFSNFVEEPHFLSTNSNVLDFDGTNDCVQAPGSGTSAFNVGTSDFTIETWLKSTVTGASQVLVVARNTNTGVGKRYALFIASTNQAGLYINLGNGEAATLYSTTDVTDESWHHVAVVRKSIRTVELYVDGVLEDSDTIIGTNEDSVIINQDVTIGCGHYPSPATPVDFLTGQMDELRIWHEARTQSQISGYKNRELHGNETNLEAYYKSNQGTAGANNTAISSVVDAINSPAQNASLNNFTLNGHVSNFVPGGYLLYSPTSVSIISVVLESVSVDELLSSLDGKELELLLSSYDQSRADNSSGSDRSKLIDELTELLDPDSDGKVAIFKWSTLEELGTVGFYIDRKDADGSRWMRINSDLLPGLIDAPLGGECLYADPGALPGVDYLYKLAEQEVWGSQREYGPYPLGY
ncbi:LamG domain-containing protein [Solemya velum gill symbiont]|nr:LamG domain-containing protein [Solemya velum gill symbiont]